MGAGVEFAEAAREYPIVSIRGQDQMMHPVILLGGAAEKTPFVDEEGKWGMHAISLRSRAAMDNMRKLLDRLSARSATWLLASFVKVVN